jgi:hypothetical protein
MNELPAEENIIPVQKWVDAINHNDVEGELSCRQPDGEYTIVATGATWK